MTTASRESLITYLLRAGFLAAALAIIAGIFGMHIMTGAHSTAAHAMPAAGTGSALTQLHDSTGHSGHGAAKPAAGAMQVAAAESSSSCSSAGACPEMSAGGAACVLAPANTFLTAPLPGTAPYASPDFGGAAAVSTNYSYSPDSPSPGDLCISRT
ncbi:hypothetical protein [Arthrobacter sp. U41]|uniref:hypothetical protein n=1 Tax=Arthrobacter sp. U41 TaxID=1849032 RepID=UPI0012F75310|nr:hypothetical protein [Arthrobacter sp. U41]